MQVNVLGYQIKELFENTKQVLVVLGKEADTDSAALAASLVELFESYNKQASLISTKNLPEAVKHLVKNEQSKPRLEPKSLVLSFDWKKHELDKVSYSLEEEKFNLIISSKGRRLKPEEITYSYKGNDFDLIVCVAVKDLEELKDFGFEEENFVSLPSLHFAKNENDPPFAKVNVRSKNPDSLSAMAVNLFKEAKINLPTRAAEAMLFGIRTATENFTKVFDPATFEAAAACKRAMIPGLTSNEETAPKVKEETKEAPENWLSPKIFRSSKFS